MNISRVLNVYEVIKNRLPKTYPRPKLIFYETEESMLEKEGIKKAIDENVYAIADPDNSTISLPLKMTVEYQKKDGEITSKELPITKQADSEIAETLLHEIGHFRFGEKYGFDSKQYSDEKRCDRFAIKWVRVLIKEKLL